MHSFFSAQWESNGSSSRAMDVWKYFFEHGWLGYTTLIQMSKIKFITIFIVSILCIYSIFHMAYMELNAHTWDVIFFNYSFASNSISGIAPTTTTRRGQYKFFSPFRNGNLPFSLRIQFKLNAPKMHKMRVFSLQSFYEWNVPMIIIWHIIKIDTVRS